MSASDHQDREEGGETEAPKSKKHQHRKDKPWDDGTVDKWKVEEFKEGDMPHHLLEESSFATLFPQYREKYLRESWPEVTALLAKYGIDCVLNLVEGSMTVKTTRKTWDPYAIIKARDLIRLLSRSVPFPQAARIMEDEMACDIIKIGGIVRNKQKFVKRRQRLIGPEGATLKALQILTECYILVQGNTVASMGSFKQLKAVRRIVEDCMKNVHPVYHIKTLMIKRELAKDPELANENWDRFLPKFKKKNVQRRKVVIKEKEYTPFPPPQQPRKVDLQMESGEFFLSKEEKRRQEEEERRKKQQVKLQEKQEKRMARFKAPKERQHSVVSSQALPAANDGPSASELATKLSGQAQKKSRAGKVAQKRASESDLAVENCFADDVQVSKLKRSKKTSKKK